MKIYKILILIFLILLLLSLKSFAISEVFDTGKDFLDTGTTYANRTIDTDNLRDRSGEIFNLFLAVAVAIAVIVGAILGAQYMTAGIDKKVEVKESLLPYIVSCIVIFGSLGIWKLGVKLLTNFDDIKGAPTSQQETSSSSSSGSSGSGSSGSGSSGSSTSSSDGHGSGTF